MCVKAIGRYRARSGHRPNMANPSLLTHHDALLLDFDAVQQGQRAATPTCKCLGSYSITSSARASSVGGAVTPIALAVARLMMSSNLVARATGMSEGFSPLRMRPV